MDTMIKTGDDHISSPEVGRAVYLNGEIVDDVTTHEVFLDVLG